MIRVAFYGRVSTEDQQDPVASKGWQLRRAKQLVEPHGGNVVEEFFDIGMSRSLPWKRRAEARRLLDALVNPDRGFEAVVIGDRSVPSTGISSASHSPYLRIMASSFGCQK